MIAYRAATPADGPELSKMAARSFTETFGTLYRPADLAAFLDGTFGVDGLPSQLDDPAYRVHLATDRASIVGFVKLGPVVFPGDWPVDAVELHQLYVLASHHGEGVGPALMAWAIDYARSLRRRQMILSVYVDNHRARRFYEQRGFEEIGRYTFMVGDQPDDDRIMRLTL